MQSFAIKFLTTSYLRKNRTESTTDW